MSISNFIIQSRTSLEACIDFSFHHFKVEN